MISQAIIPDRTTDETKLADALGKLVRDDPTLKCRTDPETKELILSGMGELHLEVSVEKLHAHAGRQGDGRQAAGGLSPNAVQGGRDRDALHQAVGRPRQVRRHQHAVSSR